MNSIHAAITSISLAIILFTCSCKSTLTTSALKHDADAAYESGQYVHALKQYESLIESWNASNAREENPYYDKAGHAALGMNDFDKALGHFSQSMHYGTASAETYHRLIEHYHKVDNISREMMTIETYLITYPIQAENDGANKRLFEIYAETSQWEKAASHWENVADEHNEQMLEQYFLVNKQLGNVDKGDELAEQLLAINPNNVVALEWIARKYYDRAEARYSTEIAAYEANKTRRQYAQLLEGYEIAGEDYRKARDIYERLFRMNPDRRYAIFLHNIYARFQDEEKAAYYRSRM